MRMAAILVVTLALWGSTVVAAQTLVDRTLALVGGLPITLSDARAAASLGLVPTDRSADPIPGVTLRLVDRELILREVQRYAPPAPSASAIDARLDELRARMGTPAAWTRVLESTGMTEGRLRAWVRDDLRAQAYLAQRFASASAPTEAEIAAAYNRGRAEYERQGLTFEQATPAIRERLTESRRADLVADWLSDLRRRADVVILQP
jgi:hypothetical protein